MSNKEKKRSRSIDAECRAFQKRWELEYFFVEQSGAALCLVCNNKVAVMKEYNLKRHYESRHKEVFCKFEGRMREEKMSVLKTNLAKQQNVFTKVSKQSKAAVKASYEVAAIIAKQGKPFTDGEFVKRCMLKVVGHVCPEKTEQFTTVSLSKQTITRRIEDIATNLLQQLQRASQKFIWYSVAHDESTDVSNTAQLLVFVRGVDENFKITEDLAGFCSMHDTTKGSDILDELKKILEKLQLSWEKLSGVTTDGAPAMCGNKTGLAGLVNKYCERFNEQPITYHCIIHQEVLCSKSLQLQHVMTVVVKTVNFIRARSLNHRQFKALLEEADAEFGDLPYHTEVRWLTRGIVLEKFYVLRNEIGSFMKEKDAPVPQLEDNSWMQDLAFLTDMMLHLNQLNTKLQGSKQFVHILFEAVKAFEVKLRIFMTHLRQHKLDHFPICKNANYAEDISFQFERYEKLVANLLQEFERRFTDFRSHEMEFRFFGSPYLVDVENVSAEFQMELVELQSDSFLKQKFLEGNLPEYYTLLTPAKYPALRKNELKIMSLFGNTFICEQTFSRMKFSKSVHRARLTDNHLHDILHISVSAFDANVDELSSDKQAQVSH